MVQCATLRIFGTSDLHLDYEENRRWLSQLSEQDYRDDLLLVAGDVAHHLKLLHACLNELRRRFREVAFIPGNHEMWVDGAAGGSFEKAAAVEAVADQVGVHTRPFAVEGIRVLPLWAWYDFSFGEPTRPLLAAWADFVRCRWPAAFDAADVTRQFLDRNEPHLGPSDLPVVSLSHFLPRIDLVPPFVPAQFGFLKPVYGTSALDEQIRRAGSRLHVCGHCHVNHTLHDGGVRYVNCAFGYPHEKRIGAHALRELQL